MDLMALDSFRRLARAMYAAGHSDDDVLNSLNDSADMLEKAKAENLQKLRAWLLRGGETAH